MMRQIVELLTQTGHVLPGGGDGVDHVLHMEDVNDNGNAVEQESVPV